jgi:hypothetical protein
VGRVDAADGQRVRVRALLGQRAGHGPRMAVLGGRADVDGFLDGRAESALGRWTSSAIAGKCSECVWQRRSSSSSNNNNNHRAAYLEDRHGASSRELGRRQTPEKSRAAGAGDASGALHSPKRAEVRCSMRLMYSALGAMQGRAGKPVDAACKCVYGQRARA